MASYSEDFNADFLYWHGRLPVGSYSHWCPDWDDLPLDVTCVEITGCGCFANDPIYQTYKDAMEYEGDTDIEFEDPVAW